MPLLPPEDALLDMALLPDEEPLLDEPLDDDPDDEETLDDELPDDELPDDEVGVWLLDADELVGIESELWLLDGVCVVPDVLLVKAPVVYVVSVGVPPGPVV
ncbi:MAG: hypothetical protein IT435_10955 [Phycisphaerales bacterium]|nr:hypothetical protein [Phycisphaerales bacterium]